MTEFSEPLWCLVFFAVAVGAAVGVAMLVIRLWRNRGVG